MPKELVVAYGWNIVVNSMATFLTILLLVEGGLMAFRIRTGALKTLLRTIPIVKLPLDLFSYSFSDWGLAKGIDPSQAFEGTRYLVASVGLSTDSLPGFISSTSLLLTTQNGDFFTFGDLLSCRCSYGISVWLLSTIGILSALLLGRYLLRLVRERSDLMALLNRGRPFDLEIGNLLLRNALCKAKVAFVISSEIESPMATSVGGARIVLPEGWMDRLTDQEKDAVVAHEFAHLRVGDLYWRVGVDLIRSFFWWIPTGFLQRSIERDQEVVADLAVQRYEINPVDLASALVREVECRRRVERRLVCPLVGRSQLGRRVQRLLSLGGTRRGRFVPYLEGGALMIFGLLLFGRIWTF